MIISPWKVDVDNGWTEGGARKMIAGQTDSEGQPLNTILYFFEWVTSLFFIAK